MSTKGLLLVIAVWFLMLWETSCTPVYVPEKVYIGKPIYCHPAIIPPFINYISPVIPKTKAEKEELAAEIEVTMDIGFSMPISKSLNLVTEAGLLFDSISSHVGPVNKWTNGVAADFSMGFFFTEVGINFGF